MKIYLAFRWLSDRLIPRRYVEVHGLDNWCVMEPREADAWIAEMNAEQDNELDPEDRQNFTKRTVWKTRHQFNSLPEFEGY